VMLVAMMDTAFLAIKDQLYTHKWHPIMAKHLELNRNNLAVMDLQEAMTNPNLNSPSATEQQNQGSTRYPLPRCMCSAFLPDHNCHNSANGCKKKVDNLCYQASNLYVEEEEGTFFGSRRCKQQKQADNTERNQENRQQWLICSLLQLLLNYYH